MSQWVKIVTDPMGLAAFALFLVFRFVAKKSKRSQGFSVSAYLMAFVALIGGLTLAYFRIHTNAVQSQNPLVPVAPQQQNIGEIKQQSSGNNAVNAAGVQGQITVINNSPSPTVTPSAKK